jgi:hypothetical protein
MTAAEGEPRKQKLERSGDLRRDGLRPSPFEAGLEVCCDLCFGVILKLELDLNGDLRNEGLSASANAGGLDRFSFGLLRILARR